MHFLLMVFLGNAILVAITTADQWRGWLIPVDPRISNLLMVITSLIASVTVINLAVSALGVLFAIALTQRLASDWMYGWTRNPMVLSTLAFFLACGLWKQSALFVLWVLFWLTPRLFSFLEFTRNVN